MAQPDETEEIHDSVAEAVDVTEAEIAGLVMDSELHGDETPKEFTRRLFEEKAPQAVIAIAKLGMAAGSERVRLDASKYIVDRVLGPLNQQDARDTTHDPLFKLMRSLGVDIDA